MLKFRFDPRITISCEQFNLIFKDVVCKVHNSTAVSCKTKILQVKQLSCAREFDFLLHVSH